MFDDPQSPAWTPLLEAAWAARDRAHAPYSRFQVGAALLTASGQVVAGCNVENAAYPVGLCAERGAVSTAVAQGLVPGGLVAAVVVTDSDRLTPPCGACRQVLYEFGREAVVIFQGADGLREMRVQELLPQAFALPR